MRSENTEGKLIFKILRNGSSVSLTAFLGCALVNIYLDQCLFNLSQYLLAFLVEELHCYGKEHLSMGTWKKCTEQKREETASSTLERTVDDILGS